MTVGGGAVPPGNYFGAFLGLEDVAENSKRGYPAGVRWQFMIVGGPCEGQVIGRVTPPTPTIDNACGAMLAGLVGRPLAKDEQVDPDHFRAKRYLLVVKKGPEGGIRVEAITPADPS
jgi:hypothetical protein